MRKLLGIIALSLVLAACGAAPATEAPAAEPTTAPAAEPTTAPEPTAEPQPTAEPEKGPVVMVWYPNESGAELSAARDALGAVISEALGRPVEHKLTTDYIIAVESIASGAADLAFMGAEGYIQAKNRNANVVPVVIPSGKSGTIDDAVYYSWLAVNKGEESNYMVDGKYAIDAIQGKRFSFVSNSSTSGFRVPSANIVKYFGKMDAWKDITADDLLEGGADNFFSDVQFGGSHQGSAVNLISGVSDVAAFCDTCVSNYVTLSEGEMNVAGSVYTVNEKADEPFDKYPGKQFVVISSTPVLNAPFAANADKLSAEEIAALQAAFTSDAVTNNPEIFATKEKLDAGYKALFKKNGDERFLVVEDSFFDPIRKLAE